MAAHRAFRARLPEYLRQPRSKRSRKTRRKNATFAIQGGVNAERDYTRSINYLDNLIHSHSSTSYPESNISLHIVGSGSEDNKHTIPASMSDRIFFDQDLDYTDYYACLPQKSALIPAFAQDDFLTVKSSSSVPASVYCGESIGGEEGDSEQL